MFLLIPNAVLLGAVCVTPGGCNVKECDLQLQPQPLSAVRLLWVAGSGDAERLHRRLQTQLPWMQQAELQDVYRVSPQNPQLFLIRVPSCNQPSGCSSCLVCGTSVLVPNVGIWFCSNSSCKVILPYLLETVEVGHTAPPRETIIHLFAATNLIIMTMQGFFFPPQLKIWSNSYWRRTRTREWPSLSSPTTPGST